MATKKTWRVLMKDQRDMRKKGIALLYERVKLLVAIYEDAEFVAYCADAGFNELDQMDAELSDIGVSFLTLKAVLNQYPRVEEWQGGNIREMIAAVIDSQKTERARQVPSWKERALAAEKECERLHGEVESLRARIADLQENLRIVASKGREPAVA